MSRHKYDLVKAHEFSAHNKNALMGDNRCGCFNCMKIFSPSEINQYINDKPMETAVCPYCGVDSVIGESSGYPITEEFLMSMHRRWFESGEGFALTTPFGDIVMLLDGEAERFEFISIDPDERLFPDIDAAYRIYAKVKADGCAHTLTMLLRGEKHESEPETGERLEAIGVYKGSGKITLACHASFGDYKNYGFDYDGELFPNEVQIDIFPTTKTEVFKFGVCWISECTEENDVQTWFGADPWD